MNLRLFFKRFLIGVTVLVLGFIGSLAIFVGPKLYYMKSEYVTAAIIRNTDRFVSEHPGEWPHSWQDLNSVDDSQYTEFRFDLTPRMIVQDRSLIYRAIQPRCHRYRTYPHAREQLDALYQKLASVPER